MTEPVKIIITGMTHKEVRRMIIKLCEVVEHVTDTDITTLEEDKDILKITKALKKSIIWQNR